MKMDQIAFYCYSHEAAQKVKKMLGLENKEWIEDEVTAKSNVNGLTGINMAHLQFNYSLGVELEILTYVHGACWHDGNPIFREIVGKEEPFLSHIGIHLEDDEVFPPLEFMGIPLVQETWTQSHTAKLLVENGRKYHYKIFELSPGTYIKYIKRIHKEQL